MTSVQIHPATIDDLEGVATSEVANLGDDAWSAGLIAEGIVGNLPTINYLVAEVDGVVVGHAVASLVGDIGELQRIAVVDSHRRRGLATDLLDAVLDLAREEEVERVLLEVREDNDAAMAFYQARGFTEIDRRPRYYRDGATAVVLERSLIGPDVKVWTTS